MRDNSIPLKAYSFCNSDYAILIYKKLTELGHCEVNENARASKRQQRGFAAGLTRFKVRHYTAEPPLSMSTLNNGSGTPPSCPGC